MANIAESNNVAFLNQNYTINSHLARNSKIKVGSLTIASTYDSNGITWSAPFANVDFITFQPGTTSCGFFIDYDGTAIHLYGYLNTATDSSWIGELATNFDTTGVTFKYMCIGHD